MSKAKSSVTFCLEGHAFRREIVLDNELSRLFFFSFLHICSVSTLNLLFPCLSSTCTKEMFFLCEVVALKKKQDVTYFLNMEQRKSKNYLLHPVFFMQFLFLLLYKLILYCIWVERSVQILNFLVSSRWGGSAWLSWSVPWSPRQCSQEFCQALRKSIF